MENHIILPETSLCAIVRDEKINPAGGIESFVNSHVPYVEQAVIADTGSVDGTREILEEMKAKYPNLEVVDIPFRSYADARNRSLKYVKTKYALILDADELLCHKKPKNDWAILKEFMDENGALAYRLFFEVIFPKKIINETIGGHTLRLFDLGACPHFENNLWEQLKVRKDIDPIWVKGVEIKHFVPSNSSIRAKWENWYLEDFTGDGYEKIPDDKRMIHWQTPPSQVEGFMKWKTLCPQRKDYI